MDNEELIKAHPHSYCLGVLTATLEFALLDMDVALRDIADSDDDIRAIGVRNMEDIRDRMDAALEQVRRIVG